MSERSSLLAIFAHPDDESFRPGGTLALLARRGVRVVVLTATRGEAGSCGDPPLCHADELATVRERELHCACAVLGIQSPRLLNYQDGRLSEANPEHVVERILAIVREMRPQVILTFGADGLSGHPDHIAIGQWASEAFHRANTVNALYTVAVPQSLATRLGMEQIRAMPDEEIAVTVDVSSVWEAKIAAIHCHATQLSSSPILSAPIERQRALFGVEYFMRAAIRDASRDLLATQNMITCKPS
jgi:N-acetylglucosamine malate deacetylase 2